jgi:hypothetical protein
VNNRTGSLVKTRLATLCNKIVNYRVNFVITNTIAEPCRLRHYTFAYPIHCTKKSNYLGWNSDIDIPLTDGTASALLVSRSLSELDSPYAKVNAGLDGSGKLEA